MIQVPGITRTPEPLPGIQAGEGSRPLTSKREAYRRLRDELGVSGPEARALYAAYERDVADAVRIGNNTSRSDVEFVDWLLRQAPGGRPSVLRKYRLGEAGWRTAT